MAKIDDITIYENIEDSYSTNRQSTVEKESIPRCLSRGNERNETSFL